MKHSFSGRRHDEKPAGGTPNRGSGAATHESIILSGCLIHSDISPAGLAWIKRVLQRDPDAGEPPKDDFPGLHLTMRVRTFADIDVCVQLASVTLGLGPVSGIGFRELVTNAVEHGNLEITYEEKTKLLEDGTWKEEIERRLLSERLRDRFASVTLRREGDRFTICIVDQGAGFDWCKYVEKKAPAMSDLHGRGLILAFDSGFESIEYRGLGNEVTLRGGSETA